MGDGTRGPNPTTIKHAILGVIAAAPNGIPITTIQNLARHAINTAPDRTTQLVTRYAKKGYVTVTNHVCTPTPKLLTERERWGAKHKPAKTTPPTNILPPRPINRAGITSDFWNTTYTLKHIAIRNNTTNAVVERHLRETIPAEEYAWRLEERHFERIEARGKGTLEQRERQHKANMRRPELQREPCPKACGNMKTVKARLCRGCSTRENMARINKKREAES